MNVDLFGKVALVTGASRGIGRAVALGLARCGAAIAVNYKENRELADEVVAQVNRLEGRAEAFGADVGDASQVETMVEAITSRLGPPDILVNNAGICRDLLLLQMEETDWDAVLRTNVSGMYHCCRAVLKGMMLKRWGRVINLSSVVAEKGAKGQANYAASKGAVNAFTRSLAMEVGPKGITVNAVAPGLIETDMTESLLPFAQGVVRERIALRRPGNPDDVASLVVFLASDAAGYITGQVIGVDGGML